jgi:hypothetical protein
MDHLDLDERTAAAIDARVAAAIAIERARWCAVLGCLIRTMRVAEEAHLESTRKALDTEVSALVGTLTELRHAVADFAKSGATDLPSPLSPREIN